MPLVGKLKTSAFQSCPGNFCDVSRSGDIGSVIGHIFASLKIRKNQKPDFIYFGQYFKKYAS